MALYSTFRASSSSAPGDALVVSMSPLIKWERNSTRCSMSPFGYAIFWASGTKNGRPSSLLIAKTPAGECRSAYR